MNDRVEELEKANKKHQEEANGLRSKVAAAEKKAAEMVAQAKTWTDKVNQATGDLSAYQIKEKYDQIAKNIDAAKENAEVLDTKSYYVSTKEETLRETVENLKNMTDTIKARAESEINNVKAYEQETNDIEKKHEDLDQEVENLDKKIDKINQWMNKTENTAKILKELKNELDYQQMDVARSENEADEIVKRIQTYEALSSSVTSDNTEGLVNLVEQNLNNVNRSIPNLSAAIEKLQRDMSVYNELEQIGNDIYELDLLISSIRDIANEIKVKN